jgi:hypothetical protein
MYKIGAGYPTLELMIDDGEYSSTSAGYQQEVRHLQPVRSRSPLTVTGKSIGK